MMMVKRNPIFRATIQFVVELYYNNNNNHHHNNNHYVYSSGTTNNSSTMSSETTTTATAVDDEDPYKSSSFIGHSLWMVPSGKSKVAYTKIVSDISSELGTFNFLPHITLVAALMMDGGSEEDVLNQTKALAAELAPYKFELDLDDDVGGESVISYRDAYFQCVYAKMKLTEEVFEANQLARTYFPERQSDPDYMPHLSLVYGDFDESTKQNMIIPKLQKAMKTIEDNEEDNNDDDKNQSSIATIPVDSIEVWSTQGDVKEWYRVATIPLTGKKKNEDKKLIQ